LEKHRKTERRERWVNASKYKGSATLINNPSERRKRERKMERGASSGLSVAIGLSSGRGGGEGREEQRPRKGDEGNLVRWRIWQRARAPLL